LIAEKLATKIGEKDSTIVEKLKTEVSDAKTKLSDTEGKLKAAENARDDAKNQLTAANKAIEDLSKQLPGGGLLKDPPVTMPVSEALALLKEVLPPAFIERAWGLGPQRMCQDVRRVVRKLEAKVGGS
jgi:septal ring factor EnvC (AmiA/AmiB activator)